MNELGFLEEESQEELCSKDELELRYRNDSVWDQDFNWDDKLAEVLGFLVEEQKRGSHTREDRIRECGKIVHSPNHRKELTTSLYLCGCLECPLCFGRARESEMLRLKSAMRDGLLHLTMIPSHKGSAAKKHIRRHDGLYRQYPSLAGRDIYVIDENAKQALSSHSRMSLKFEQLEQPSLTWEKVLVYVSRRHRSGSLGKPRVAQETEEEKIRLVFKRVTMHRITARQKRDAWVEAMKLTPDIDELTADVIQDACNACADKWVELCESLGAVVKSFGVQVRLVPISQLEYSSSSCEMCPRKAYDMCPDYIDGVPTGTKEPELALV